MALAGWCEGDAEKSYFITAKMTIAPNGTVRRMLGLYWAGGMTDGSGLAEVQAVIE